MKREIKKELEHEKVDEEIIELEIEGLNGYAFEYGLDPKNLMRRMYGDEYIDLYL